MSAETGREGSTGALENTRENVVDQASSPEVSVPVAPLRGSYASATRGNNVELTRNDNLDPENALPSRPFTVYFHPRYYVPSHDVFDALRQADIDAQAVSCIQRQSNGAIILTFRRAEFKERFLRRNVLSVQETPYLLQDIDRPLTHLQVFDAPHELPDLAIVERLSKFCDVVSHRRGFFRQEGWENVHDGVRHYRVRIRRPIPSFSRFGKILIHLRHPGQLPTCRNCHQTGHMANSCATNACFNCDSPGHLASHCPESVKCNICRSPDHRANSCPHSWLRVTPPGTSSDATNSNANTAEANSPPSTDADLQDCDLTPPDVSPAVDGQTAPELIGDQTSCDASETDFFSPREESDTDMEPSETPHQLDEPDATLELFENTPNSSTPAPNGRKPAKVIVATIPLRKPTIPQLFHGKSAENLSEKRDTDASEISDTEHSPTKRTKPNGRSGKGEKRR